MDAELEPRPGRQTEVQSSKLNQEVVLRRKDAKLTFDRDGSVTSVESLSERRLLFGRESLTLHKVQAGIKVRSQNPDWKLSVSPYSATFSGRVFDTVEVLQRIEFCELPSTGSIRRVRLVNSGGTQMRILLTTLHDPTTAHYRPATGEWGSISVNAFNRSSHIAMDEVADPPAARVVGSSPPPKSIYMTTDLARAEESIKAAELPDSTAGMSGQILIVMFHEFELPPQASMEISVASLYDSLGLEQALSDFKRVFNTKGPERTGLVMECQVEGLNAAMRWVAPSLEGSDQETDLLDRLECLPGLTFSDSSAARRLVDNTLHLIRRDGFLPHARSASSPGHLESALLLTCASELAQFMGDKKYAKLTYRSLRKIAEALCELRHDVEASALEGLPAGWRRELGKGCPSGIVPEVLLASAAALSAASGLALTAGKPEDSARYIERAEMILDSLRREVVDENGLMALFVDRDGRAHRDDTLDQAVGLYRNPFDRRLASAEVHRLQADDFDTDYGPRTMPTSNRVFFNGSYGEGQLGGFWTRAALASAALAYSGGFPGLGSLQLQKIGRLVGEDAPRFGRVPGPFPLWVDIERRVAHGRGSDPVSASRLLEVVVRGELGFSMGVKGPRIAPALLSSLRWLMTSGLWLGEDVSVFIGRAEGKVFAFVRGSKILVDGGTKYSGFEIVRAGSTDLSASMFYGPGQLICVGNRSAKSVRSTISFGPKEAALFNHLSTGVEELVPSTGSWNKTQMIRVSSAMTLDVFLEPGSWKALRLRTD